MPNLDFDAPSQIISPRGVVSLNDMGLGSSGLWWKVLPDSYKIVPTLRFVQDNVSQQDGSVLHPRFLSGQVATFKVEYRVATSAPEYNGACDEDLLEMSEQMILVCNSLRSNGPTPATNQRFTWEAADSTSRGLIRVMLLGWPDPVWTDPAWVVTVALETPFPYAIDLNQIDTPINDSGGPALVPNDGNMEFWPVIEVGPNGGFFTITNEDSGEVVVYNGAAIGGGDHLELDFFTGTAYLNGDSTDEIDGIDPTSTDWFTIKPDGGTNVSIVGADADVLSNNAWG